MTENKKTGQEQMGNLAHTNKDLLNSLTNRSSEDDYIMQPEQSEPPAIKAEIECWVPLERPNGILGGLKLIVTKIVRKLNSFYMSLIINQQIRYNREVVNIINQMWFNQRNTHSQIKYLEAQLTKEKENLEVQLVNTNKNLEVQLADIKKNLETQLTDMREKFKINIETLQYQCECHSNLIERTQNSYTELNDLVYQIKTGSDQKSVIIKKVQEDYLSVMLRLGRLQNENISQDTPSNNYPAKDKYTKYRDTFDYFAFEGKFRGSREDIKKKQMIYVPYFTNRSNILDFGCGRGEFLELLKENGISATGFDLNADNVSLCKQLSLNVEQKDALLFLEECNDDSLGGIIALQIVEHLSTEMMMYLLNLAHRKMQYGAPFIMETLNPQCLMIYAESLYLDPSHIKPVHPYTLQFMAESAGFNNNELLFMTPSDASMRVPHIPDNEAFNTSIDVVNGILFGNREYALIAYK